MALRNIEPDELKKILEDHLHWLREDCDGWEDMRADLSGADLSGANLSGANLSMADLSGANLSVADLSWAILKNTTIWPGWKIVKEEGGENQ